MKHRQKKKRNLTKCNSSVICKYYQLTITHLVVIYVLIEEEKKMDEKIFDTIMDKHLPNLIKNNGHKE